MIPKIVNTNVGPNYNWKEKSVSRYAPFATNDTPETSLKIVGGRLMIVENSSSKSHTNNGQNSDLARKSPPTEFIPVRGKAKDAYHTNANSSAELGANRSQLLTQTNLAEEPRSLNPHYLLPPIPRSVNQSKASEHAGDLIVNQSNGRARGMDTLGLERHLLDTVMLPDKRIRLNLTEEAELRQRIAEDLEGLSSQLLKDVYLELTTFDPKLTGYVHFNDLTFTLLRSQVNLSISNQRLVSALFLSELEPNKVNYEQFLYFLSSSMKRNHNLTRSDFMSVGEANSFPSGYQHPPGIDREPASRRGFHDNASNNSNVMEKAAAPSTREIVHQRTEYDTSQLLRVVEGQLKERDARHLDIDRIWDVFRHTDRSHSQALSREQIKTLSYQCKIRLDEDILDQVIDRCHKGNGLYWWEKFLNFVGHFLIHKTGLNIPEGKRPKDFAKYYSPRGSNQAEDRTDRGFASKENQLAAVEKKEKEIARLEKFIQIARQRLDEMKRTSVQPEPWLKRFMSLAHAMYEFDENKTGYLTAMEAQWLTREYSRGLELGLTDDAIRMAITRCTDDVTQAVPVEQLLRMLVSQG